MSHRESIATAARVVVKIGSSSLTRPGGGLDPAAVSALADSVAQQRLAGRQLIVVTSGAIAAAVAPLELRQRPRDLATQQAAASVGQGSLMAAYGAALHQHGLLAGQVLLTADDMVRRSHHRNAQRTLYRLLELGVVPIVNENDTVATDEIRFGDNDRLAALVAHLVHADALVLLSDVDGLYDTSPHRPGANLISEVHHPDELREVAIDERGRSGVGSGGMRTKLAAARMAADAGVPVVLAAADAAAAALAGDPVGTYFHVTGRRRPARLLWLHHAASTQGQLVIDAGAADAVVRRGASLLPAGVCTVSGEFQAGDPVDLLTETGHIVARGLVNFDAVELPQLLGRSTKELAAELGASYEREVVHRDDLVILDRPGS